MCCRCPNPRRARRASRCATPVSTSSTSTSAPVSTIPDRFPLRKRLTNSANYYLASLFFAAFPLPQREVGARHALRYIGEVVESGFSVLIFPEGRRTDAGEIAPFQPGVGMMASRLNLPVVPIRIEGLDRILHHSWRFPRRGRARVTFGPAMSLRGNDYAALAKEVEEAVRRLGTVAD